jgi:hypothetical protein
MSMTFSSTISPRFPRTIAAAVAIAASALTLSSANAWPATAQTAEPLQVSAPVVAVDWQGPWSLPPRFRNHCGYAVNHGAWRCSDHCGIDYQFYFCSPASFGCCHPGYGYCDWNDHLRCAP